MRIWLAVAVTLTVQNIFAAKFDFNKIPKDKVLNCSGQDSVSEDPTGIQLVVGPEGMHKGEPRRAVYGMISDLAGLYNMPVMSQVIGVKSLKNSEELYAFLNSYMVDLLLDASIREIAATPAAYPVSVLVGKQVYINEGSQKKEGTLLWVAVSGMLSNNSEGKAEEGTFTFLTYRPNSGSKEAPELLSGGLTTCDYLNVSDFAQ